MNWHDKHWHFFISDQEFPHNQVSPTSGSTNQSHLLRHCSGSQQQQSNFISRPSSCGNHQQNNISLQHTGIPKVHQLEVYSNIENQNNPSVTSSLQGGCSTSSSSIGLSSSNENAQSNTSRSCGKYFWGKPYHMKF